MGSLALTAAPRIPTGVLGLAAGGGDRSEELRLVGRALAGEVGAFEEIYRRNVGRVYGLCLRLTSDAALAEELTQDAFVRAWERLGSFRGESALYSWLYRLATNVVFSEHRTARRRTARIVTTDDLSSYDDPTPTDQPGSGLDLERAIASLPPGARQVFVLHDVEGYQHGEISAMTGVAIGTSKAQLHRARRLLREALGR